jgi:hypothetical protein
MRNLRLTASRMIAALPMFAPLVAVLAAQSNPFFNGTGPG